MDSLTHIVIGAAIGELVLGKKIGNKAMLWGAIAATIPDLDVVCGPFVDPVRKIELHRGVTHSLLFILAFTPLVVLWTKRHPSSLLSVFCVLLASVFALGNVSLTASMIITAITFIVVALILWKVNRMLDVTTKEWRWLFGLALLSHPLLDCMTAYGTHLLWPLPTKVAFNNFFIADPSFTLPALVCVILALFFQRGDRRRYRLSVIGLGVGACYVVLTLGMKWKAHSTISASLQRQGVTYTSLSTRPSPFNSVLWVVAVESADHYGLGYYSLLDTKPEVELVNVPKGTELLGKWAHHPTVERLIRLTDNSYIIKSQNDTLVLCDLRFGQAGAPTTDARFIYEFRLIPDGENLQAEWTPPPSLDGATFKRMLTELWTRLKGE